MSVGGDSTNIRIFPEDTSRIMGIQGPMCQARSSLGVSKVVKTLIGFGKGNFWHLELLHLHRYLQIQGIRKILERSPTVKVSNINQHKCRHLRSSINPNIYMILRERDINNILHR